MVSRRKRSSYVTESEYSSDEDADYSPPSKQKTLLSRMRSIQNSTIKEEIEEETLTKDAENASKSRCTSRNAVIARKNRIRKKMYIQNLENEVSKLRNTKEKLNSIISNQSLVISDLRRELKYMRSVLANSSDICNLIKNIRNSTGMSVTTSLDKTLSMNNNCVSKRKGSVAGKTAHPWEDPCTGDHNIPIPQRNIPDVSFKMDSKEDLNLSSGFSDLDLQLDMDIPFPELLFNFDESATLPQSFEAAPENLLKKHSKVMEDTSAISDALNEHNYTATFTSNYSASEDNVGVCLHVSQHRVSLEFCSSCSDNANHAWKELE